MKNQKEEKTKCYDLGGNLFAREFMDMIEHEAESLKGQDKGKIEKVPIKFGQSIVNTRFKVNGIILHLNDKSGDLFYGEANREYIKLEGRKVNKGHVFLIPWSEIKMIYRP